MSKHLVILESKPACRQTILLPPASQVPLLEGAAHVETRRNLSKQWLETKWLRARRWPRRMARSVGLRLASSTTPRASARWCTSPRRATPRGSSPLTDALRRSPSRRHACRSSLWAGRKTLKHLKASGPQTNTRTCEVVHYDMPADAEEGVEVVQGLQCGLVKVTVQPEPPGLQRKETQPMGDIWVGRPRGGRAAIGRRPPPT